MARAIIIGLVALALGVTAIVVTIKLIAWRSTTITTTATTTTTTVNNDDSVEVFDESINRDAVSAYSALYGEDETSMRLMARQMTKMCGPDSGQSRGIYVDFIYNPKYYFEFTVLRQMLQEILNGNPHMRYYYDTVHLSNSTIITVGYEHMGSRFSERSVITIKPKLLKDILYTANIFDQIYNFLLTYFRTCITDPTLVPEYDRTINFKRYRSVFADTLAAIDNHNQATTICRNDELYNERYQGRVRIVARVEASEFRDPSTVNYWNKLLSQLGIFMTELLSETFVMQACPGINFSCYTIELVPEIDIRRVLLFPHAAVKTAMRSESLRFEMDSHERIADDIILFKHRILHALGVGHRYSKRAIMNAYTNDWQFQNLFGILEEDYVAMARCYGSDMDLADLDLRRSPDVRPPTVSPGTRRYRMKKYVTDLRESDTSKQLLKLFVTSFDEFIFKMRSK